MPLTGVVDAAIQDISDQGGQQPHSPVIPAAGMAGMGKTGAISVRLATTERVEQRVGLLLWRQADSSSAICRNLASARCWATRTAPGDIPSTLPVSSADNPETTRKSSNSR